MIIDTEFDWVLISFRFWGEEMSGGMVLLLEVDVLIQEVYYRPVCGGGNGKGDLVSRRGAFRNDGDDTRAILFQKRNERECSSKRVWKAIH